MTLLRAATVAAGVAAVTVCFAGGERAAAEPSRAEASVQRFVIPPRPGAPAVRIDLESQDHVLATWTARGITLLEGPSHAKTWPFGRSGRVLLIATTDDRGDRTTRVLAEQEGCSWREPEVPFEEVRSGPSTFTFTQAIAGRGASIPLRWEASLTGVRVQRALASDWYQSRSSAARRELDEIRGRAASDCARAPRRDGPRAVELATDIYVWSIAARGDAAQARARLSADLAAAPDCALTFIGSPGWRADAELEAVTFGERLAGGRFDTGQDVDDQACEEMPVTVAIRATTGGTSTTRSVPAAPVQAAWNDLGF